ncbi:hypothetical protein [Cohnella nanjingensis]|uniref:Uncharacterized protein n=1 Tax=Cohnella nanjingensis TaxID=1387779 RepID=A0A7X0VE36_9BACL|nr:hypothetical protein [Cohnella nanjingensis]MBB6669863.1 hypothetical protein [Cohnella nanjingensis]
MSIRAYLISREDRTGDFLTIALQLAGWLKRLHLEGKEAPAIRPDRFAIRTADGAVLATAPASDARARRRSGTGGTAVFI